MPGATGTTSAETGVLDRLSEGAGHGVVARNTQAKPRSGTLCEDHVHERATRRGRSAYERGGGGKGYPRLSSGDCLWAKRRHLCVDAICGRSYGELRAALAAGGSDVACVGVCGEAQPHQNVGTTSALTSRDLKEYKVSTSMDICICSGPHRGRAAA